MDTLGWCYPRFAKPIPCTVLILHNILSPVLVIIAYLIANKSFLYVEYLPEIV